MVLLTLYPYAQGDGSGEVGGAWEIIDPPTWFGDGSLSDDSDDSGATIGAEYDVDSNHHGQPVAVWFKTPSGFDPFALLIQTRMRNTADAFAYPYDASRAMLTRLSSADGSVMFDSEDTPPGGGNPSPISDILIPATSTPTDFIWYGTTGAASIDLDNPSEAGGWYQLDWSFNRDAGDKTALMGDGLRLDLGFFLSGAAGNPGADWFDLYEVRLIVAGDYGATKAPPCRLYPREDHQGVGSGRIWPPPRSQQASNRRAGGYY